MRKSSEDFNLQTTDHFITGFFFTEMYTYTLKSLTEFWQKEFSVKEVEENKTLLYVCAHQKNRMILVNKHANKTDREKKIAFREEFKIFKKKHKKFHSPCF